MPANSADFAVQLPWLAPSVSALAALARGAAFDDPAIFRDPAAIILVLRFASHSDDQTILLTPKRRSRLLRFAQERLAHASCGLVRLDVLPIAEAARGHAPSHLAERAYIVGVLSQLGRLATGDSSDSHRTVASRLARRWALPQWCQTALDLFDHPTDAITALGGDAELIAAAKTAEHAVGQLGSVDEIQNPYAEKLLPDLLAAAQKRSRRDQTSLVQRLEDEIDRLRHAFGAHVNTENARLHERKLSALAELAAGAGHEINTPLAIISGQAQYLLAGEESPERRKSLQTVVHQAHRVHELLTDLMQFARPLAPEPQVFDVGLLARDVAAAFAGAAERKEVLLEVDVAVGTLGHADPKHTRTALHCLVKNAIEAVEAAGRVRIRQLDEPGRCAIAVEDSGPGVPAAFVEHMYDPFFSGRSAGRGRGLGLSTAWRLSRLQGGDLRYFPPSDGPTRFVLTFAMADAQPIERRSA